MLSIFIHMNKIQMYLFIYLFMYVCKKILTSVHVFLLI